MSSLTLRDKQDPDFDRILQLKFPAPSVSNYKGQARTLQHIDDISRFSYRTEAEADIEY
jgi:hypothetical protein